MQSEFITLINSSQGIIHSVMNKYCHDQQEHDDLKQEILKAAWLAFPRFRGEAKFSTWLYKVASYTAITKLRDLKKSIYTVGLHNIFYDIEDTPVSEPDFHWNRISDYERELLMLWAEDVPCELVTVITGMSAGTFRTRICRIKAKLKDN